MATTTLDAETKERLQAFCLQLYKEYLAEYLPQLEKDIAAYRERKYRLAAIQTASRVCLAAKDFFGIEIDNLDLMDTPDVGE